MKNQLHFILALTLIVSIPTFLQAQIVGSDAFMQGNYVEAGINECGVFASSGPPPEGYATPSLSGLNFIADTDMDGWNVGDPNYCGDYAIPGSPLEGWGIQINDANYYNTDQACFYSDIPGEIISYEADDDSVVVVWEGSVAGVTITQRTILYMDNLYMVTQVTLTNYSGADINDIYYKRNIDPDNEQMWTGSFVTINTIDANPILGDSYAVVSAVGETYGCYLALVAANLFASGSYGNFSTNTGTAVSDSYNGLNGYDQSGTLTGDYAIQMSFWIPALSNGSTTEFAFAYVFSEDAVEEALAELSGEDFCVPAPPSDIYVDEITATSANIHWTMAPGTEGTRVTLWELPTSNNRKFNVYDESSFMLPSVLTPSTDYAVRLKSGCINDDIYTSSGFSDWYYFTTLPLREGEFAQSVTVYPNPSDGKFRIQLNGYAETEAQVFISNAIGQIVYSEARMLSSDVEVIDFALKLAAGTYFIKVISGNEILNQVIVIE